MSDWPDWLTFRPIAEWPGNLTMDRQRSPFSASFSTTISLLSRELDHLDGTRPILQVALSEKDLRIDGKPKARALARHPGVILAFTMEADSPIFGHRSQAASYLRDAAQLSVGESYSQSYDVLYKAAARRHHPDAGGDPSVFVKVQEAHRMLTSQDPAQFAVDKFQTWQDNLRAIALGLEALRKVERYGIAQRREQYKGWKQLTGGAAS